MTLRARLLAYGLGVAAVAIAVVALFVARGTRREVDRFVLAEAIVDPAPGGGDAGLGAALERDLRAGATLAQAIAALPASPAPRRALLLAAASERVLATVPADADRPAVERLPDGGLRIETRGHGTTQVEMVRGGLVPLHGPDGAVVARLLALPAASVGDAAGDDRDRAHRLVDSLTRNLALAAALAAAVALLLGLALARRLSRPIEGLTRVARALGEGRRGLRAPTDAPREVAELGHAFNDLADALERTEAARRRLVGDVAHELRTPLTRLRGQVEALRDGLAPLDAAAVESLYEEALLLSRLVEDVQLLAEADAGALPLRREPVDLGELLRRAATAVAAQARHAGVTVRVEARAAPLLADPERLAQVLGNLLANAFAHARPNGTVALRARDVPGAVEVVVEDDGAGIGPEHLPHVFDRFYRADPARSRDRGGSGLGLAIVREIAEAHGGTATLASAPGEGTRVTLRLPR